MDNLRMMARLAEHQLRIGASTTATALGGRPRSAERLDQLFHDVVELCRPDVFVEVGAYEATASRRVKQALPSCEVLAYEASPVNAAHHTENVDFEALGINYVHSAVCGRTGTIQLPIGMFEGEDHLVPHGNSSLMGSPRATTVSSVEVPATTLDEITADVGGRVALWIDVEGAVGSVLEGATETLERVDIVKVEVEDHEIWPRQMTASEVIESLMRSGLFPVARDVEYPSQYNLLFVSDRAQGVAGVWERVSSYLHTQSHRHSELACWLRDAPAVRRALRPVRRAVPKRLLS